MTYDDEQPSIHFNVIIWYWVFHNNIAKKNYFQFVSPLLKLLLEKHVIEIWTLKQ